ncbi:hypothetical protein [Paenibacillus wenxiniae]|uniref:Nucleotide-diphospho-sugar transferase domain-containing protein n=1 Tax=Paenibacillus wenxiniae TaxID=1636843 RepID=A0ABW4RH87_9BACL
MKVVISCVAENTPIYHLKVINLFSTIKQFGGKLHTASRIAYFVDNVDDDIKDRLANIGVECRIIQAFDSRSPHCNKIRMLEMEDDYDILVMLDCDMVVVKDFSESLSTDAIMLKPCNTHTLRLETWRSMFQHLGVPFPNHRVLTTYSRVYTVPYFNSGLVIVPKKYTQLLYTSWKNHALELLEQYPYMSKYIAENSFYTDQFALTLSLSSAELPYTVLDVSYNFSTHHSKIDDIPDSTSAYILHYHSHVNSKGHLEKTGYMQIDTEIETINDFLANHKL